MDNFIPNNNSNSDIEDCSMLDTELSSFYIQPGFVEGILPDAQTFSTLSEAFQHIFRHNKEYCILSWNGIPIKLSYSEDFPFLIKNLIDLLKEVVDNQEYRDRRYDLNSVNMDCQWYVSIKNNKTMTIHLKMNRIKGNYQASLNALSLLSIDKEGFLAEWKFVFEQFTLAMSNSGASMRSKEGKESIDTLNYINNTIKERGKLYS